MNYKFSWENNYYKHSNYASGCKMQLNILDMMQL